MEEKEILFDEAILQLEEIVRKLEQGDVPLEDAISLYKRGMELSTICHQKLQHAEKQLISLMDENGAKKPFNPEHGDGQL